MSGLAWRAWLGGSVALLLGLAALQSARAAAGEPTRGELFVFAAASLREVFEALVPSFEQARPGTKVRLNLAGSQELRTQIEQGARADVFASADQKQMEALAQQALVQPPLVFARNALVIVVPRENPAGIHALTDLPRTRRLVVGVPEVPIGRYTLEVFAAAARKYGPAWLAKVEASVVSRELNVRQVLAKVTLGEADAGIVYRTDAQVGRDRVEVVAIPASLNAVPEYPIAVVKSASQPGLAQAWLDLVRGPEGQRRLTAAGFLTAPSSVRPPTGKGEVTAR